MTLFKDFFEALGPGFLRGKVGAQLMQGMFSYQADLAIEAARLAVKLAWVKSPEQPPDALLYLGQERLLPAFPTEPAANHRARLADAWNIWATAGNPETLEASLASAGYPLTVYERHEWPTKHPVGYWSIFWLLDSTNSIPASPPSTYGDGTTYGQPGVYYGMHGPSNLPAIVDSIRKAIKKMRPAHVILGHVIIPGTAPLYGTGHKYGDVGLTYGGTSPMTFTP